MHCFMNLLVMNLSSHDFLVMSYIYNNGWFTLVYILLCSAWFVDSNTPTCLSNTLADPAHENSEACHIMWHHMQQWDILLPGLLSNMPFCCQTAYLDTREMTWNYCHQVHISKKVSLTICNIILTLYCYNFM